MTGLSDETRSKAFDTPETVPHRASNPLRNTHSHPSSLFLESRRRLAEVYDWHLGNDCIADADMHFHSREFPLIVTP